MLTNFLLKRQIADLIHRSRHERKHSDQYSCILELGALPPTEESINCLILHTVDDLALKPPAILALGLLDDFRARNHLLRLLRSDGMRPDSEMEKALSQPHHVKALTELAGIAHDNCRPGADNWLASRLVDLMQRIDPVASQPHIESLARVALDGALRELRQDKLTGTPRDWAEKILAHCKEGPGVAALHTLQDAMVPHHRQVINTAARLEQIAASLDWLRKSNRPAAAEAVAEFLRATSRRVVREAWYMSGYDRKSCDEDCYTSELGQQIGAEEQAERESLTRARQAHEDAEAKRRHRENVYPALLSYGEQQDLEDYVHACLTNPSYDLGPRHHLDDPGTPKLNKLAGCLHPSPYRNAAENAKAAELLRLILAGDRTLLWANTRKAIAEGVGWKDLALELLELTGAPEAKKPSQPAAPPAPQAVAPVPVPPPTPPAEAPRIATPIPAVRPATPAELWARVLAQLEKRRATPAGSATPADIARHADTVLGHDQVSRFVRDYYYPAIYAGSPVPAAAQAWVEQFEKPS